jgi:hypothetical protein
VSARTQPRVQLARSPRRGRDRRVAAPDATTEPDPGPPPEAVFDRVTGPYARRSAVALPGARACDEDP